VSGDLRRTVHVSVVLRVFGLPGLAAADRNSMPSWMPLRPQSTDSVVHSPSSSVGLSTSNPLIHRSHTRSWPRGRARRIV